MIRLDGHVGDVRAVAFTPAGRVVSGGSDRTVRVWDPARGDCLAVARAKAKAPVYAVAAAPDGSVVAFAGRAPPRSATNVVTLIDPATGAVTGLYELRTEDTVYRLDQGYNLTQAVEPVSRSIWALSFSADGRHMAVAYRKPGGANMPVGAGGYVWRRDDRTGDGPLPGNDIYTVQFAPAGTGLAATAAERVYFYDAPGRPDPVVEYPLQCTWAAAVAFLPTGDVAVVAAGSFLHCVGTTAARKLWKVKTGLRVLTAVAASPDGRVVLAGGTPKAVEVYDAATGARLAAYDFGVGSVHALAFAPDGLTFAVAGYEGLAVCDAAFG